MTSQLRGKGGASHSHSVMSKVWNIKQRNLGLGEYESLSTCAKCLDTEKVGGGVQMTSAKGWRKRRH